VEILKVKNISSGYGKKQVLYDVSLQVNKGEVVLLTGGNGSGKSTLLKCIYNLLLCWSGEIFFEEKKINGLKPFDLIRRGIVYIPQKNNYFENLSINENLELSGFIMKKNILADRISNIYSEFHSLKNSYSRTPFNLSGGERQILALSMALIHNPQIILFDEPLSGLDQKNSSFIMDKIEMLNEDSNVSFLIVEHKIHTKNIANKVIDLYLGKIITKSIKT
jgi:branched-chain amino acid transport system ATP-binding protein